MMQNKMQIGLCQVVQWVGPEEIFSLMSKYQDTRKGKKKKTTCLEVFEWQVGFDPDKEEETPQRHPKQCLLKLQLLTVFGRVELVWVDLESSTGRTQRDYEYLQKTYFSEAQGKGSQKEMGSLPDGVRVSLLFH